MKHTRRILALVLTLVLTLGLCVTAFAEEAAADKGSITIDNAVKGQTYTIYKLFDLSHNENFSAITYTVNTDWANFFKEDADGRNYVNVDAQNYVTEKTGVDYAAFAKAAKTFAADHNITNKGQAIAGESGVKFEELELGYYLVDSDLGVLCALNTAMPNVIMREKNSAPTNEKTVEEDSTQSYGKVNDADIGQTVNFKSVVVVKAGGQHYMFHDKMTDGLTLNSISDISVELNGVAVDTAYYTVKTGAEITDGCTFEIEFTQAFCDSLTVSCDLIIRYSAKLNKNAVVAGEGNVNSSHLEYGEEGRFSTTPSITRTYTWGMDVLKYANNDEKKVLSGVKFVLLNSDKTKVAQVVDGKLTSWAAVPENAEAQWPANAELTTDEDGKIAIDGLDAGTYYLRETKELPGYNKLADDQKVEIVPEKDDTNDTMHYTRPMAKVNNQTGTTLPSTGGIGTTVFYVLGSAMALGAVILLVTKKRMAA